MSALAWRECVERYVREQGGRFDIRSDKTGTTITVTMPVVDPKDAASELASAPSTD